MRRRPLACLPMYDWPEIRADTDALWQALGRACRARGIDAPETLTRGLDPMKAWLNPRLVLAQTCGLPYARHLGDRVRLVGSPTYALPDCPPGDYYSVVITSRGVAARTLDDLGEGRRFAFNGFASQSGFRAMVEVFRALGRDASALARGVVTGSHRNSIRAVAEGIADFAAIDGVSWLLAERHEPAARAVRPLCTTPPTPGLPLISGPGADTERLSEAVADGIGGLDGRSARALGLTGFRRREAAEYAGYA